MVFPLVRNPVLSSRRPRLSSQISSIPTLVLGFIHTPWNRAVLVLKFAGVLLLTIMPTATFLSETIEEWAKTVSGAK